jgi:uncharacterized protein (TIGR02270 family)
MLDQLLQLAGDVADAGRGLLSAFGWVSASTLEGIVQPLLRAQDSRRRVLGIGICRVHRVDAGAAFESGARDSDDALRAASVRAAGEIGRQDMVRACGAALDGTAPDTHFWAARSLALLGSRGKAVDALARAGSGLDAQGLMAFRLALQMMGPDDGHAALQRLASEPEQFRRVVLGSGIVGDPMYVPWLIAQMTDARMARLAGESLSVITGADLSMLGLERLPPGGFESGPNDDPNDANVEMDPDEGLPWPDRNKIEVWWAANAHRFQKGQRYFMGAPVTREHCIDVLKTGYQQQRILAAYYLCLLNPGTPLFNTSAPAWRQQRLLAQMQ